MIIPVIVLTLSSNYSEHTTRIKTIKLKSLVNFIRVYKIILNKEGNNSKIKFLKALGNQRFSARNFNVSKALSIREG